MLIYIIPVWDCFILELHYCSYNFVLTLTYLNYYKFIFHSYLIAVLICSYTQTPSSQHSSYPLIYLHISCLSVPSSTFLMLPAFIFCNSQLRLHPTVQPLISPPPPTLSSSFFTSRFVCLSASLFLPPASTIFFPFTFSQRWSCALFSSG